MTTAHRPQLKATVAGRGGDYGNYSSGGQVSAQFSSLELPAHLTMKTRAPGQNAPGELAVADLKAKLEAREEEARRGKLGSAFPELSAGAAGPAAGAAGGGAKREREPLLLLDDDDEVDVSQLEKYGDGDAEGGVGGEDDSDLDSSDDDSDDSDDDEEELQRELEKIRRERAEAAARQEEDERAAAVAAAPGLAADGEDPLKAGGSRLKRKWNDDVVFRNQAKDEPKAKKRFVNDSIRNDFHRRFMRKYVR